MKKTLPKVRGKTREKKETKELEKSIRELERRALSGYYRMLRRIK